MHSHEVLRRATHPCRPIDDVRAAQPKLHPATRLEFDLELPASEVRLKLGLRLGRRFEGRLGASRQDGACDRALKLAQRHFL